MKLKAGQQAPLFQTTDIYGRQVALAQYFGQKLLLSFYRAAVCPRPGERQEEKHRC